MLLFLGRMVIRYEYLFRLFRSRDKPQNCTAGSAYSFFFGGSSVGKWVNERSAMQMTARYPLMSDRMAVDRGDKGSFITNTPPVQAMRRFLKAVLCA